MELKFKLDAEVDETTADGRDVKTVVSPGIWECQWAPSVAREVVGSIPTSGATLFLCHSNVSGKITYVVCTYICYFA